MADDQGLSAGEEVALGHETTDVMDSGAPLTRDFLRHEQLAAVVASAIAMTAVHHQTRLEAFLCKARGRILYRGLVVVGSGAASQDDVAVLVAGRRDHGRFPGLGDAKKLLWTTRRD